MNKNAYLMFIHEFIPIRMWRISLISILAFMQRQAAKPFITVISGVSYCVGCFTYKIID